MLIILHLFPARIKNNEITSSKQHNPTMYRITRTPTSCTLMIVHVFLVFFFREFFSTDI